MPFHTTQQYFANDTKAEDSCPYGCITRDEAAPVNGTQQLKVDEELCTDCGACALACPGKFEYARAFTRYTPAPRIAVTGPLVGSIGGWDGIEEVTVETARKIPAKKAAPRVPLAAHTKAKALPRMAAARH